MKNVENENTITIFYEGADMVINGAQNQRYYAALEDAKQKLVSLNLNRGGKNTYGFTFEPMHAAKKNISNLKSSNGEIIEVIDDNGPADFRTIDAKGNVTYQQAKVGYHGSNKSRLLNKLYKKMPRIIDKNNDETIKYAQEKNIPYEESAVSKGQAKALTKVMQTEGKVRQEFGLSNTGPVVGNLYMTAMQMEAAHVAGIKTAKGAAPLATGIILGKNFYEFLEGDVELREMLFDSAKEAAKSQTYAYIGGATNYLVAGVTAKFMKDSVLFSVGQSFGVLLPTAAVPIFLLGMALGAGCAMCKSIKVKNEQYRRKKEQINATIGQALSAMQMAYNSLDQELKEFCAFWDSSFDQGFRQMMASVSGNDFEGFCDGLETVLQVFDAHVLFKTEQDFDDFFFNDDAVLNL